MTHTEYRHEYKLAINQFDCHTIRQRVRAVARPDPHAGAGGLYHIRSLYFDSDDDKALREKLDGLPNREKFRIRLYNGGRDLIRLEKKSKTSGLCRKESVPLTEEEARRILAGDIGWMRDSPQPLVAELYGKMGFLRLKPRTLVDYLREAYIFPYGNVRITLDSQVRTGLYSTDLFATDLPTLAVDQPGVLLLEVKYDRFLPDVIRDVIQTNTRQTQAFSKYAACRIYG